MVKVSELRGQVPGEGGAGSTSLQALQALIVPEVPSISSYVRDMRLALAPSLNAFEKTRELFLAKRSWPGLGDVPHQINGFRFTVVPTGFESSVRRMIAVQVGFHVQTVRLPTLPKPALPKLPPEVIEYIRAQKALKEGDQDAFWRFVEKQLGRPPDDLLREVLDLYFLPHVDRLPSWVILGLLEHHRRRLSYDRPEKWHAWLAEQTYRRLRKNPNYRLMQALRYYPGSPYKRLEAELRKAVAAAERDGFFGGFFGELYSWHNKYMLGDVERQIIHTNRPLRDTRSRQERDDVKRDAVVSLEVLSEKDYKQFLSTPDLDEAFTELEDERRRRRNELSKGLPPKE
jgi:hypothetical protein